MTHDYPTGSLRVLQAGRSGVIRVGIQPDPDSSGVGIRTNSQPVRPNPGGFLLERLHGRLSGNCW